MTHEIKEYGNYLNIRITLDDGNQYEIRAEAKQPFLQISTIDGRMIINPSVSNVIKITTIQ